MACISRLPAVLLLLPLPLLLLLLVVAVLISATALLAALQSHSTSPPGEAATSW